MSNTLDIEMETNMATARKGKTVFNIGYKIRAFREANHLTQEQLADLMNCSFKTIGNMENDRVIPDLKQVINLCDLLKISIDELLEGCLNKCETYQEMQEQADTYPDFVYRTQARPDLSKNTLQAMEKIIMNIRDMKENEIRLLEGIVDSIIANR